MQTIQSIEELESLYGKAYQAARIALDHDDTGRAIRSLQVLPPSDDDYVEAANLLVDERGSWIMVGPASRRSHRRFIAALDERVPEDVVIPECRPV